MPFDALVLLGCRVAAGALPPTAGRRVKRAAEAFHAGLAPRVVVSGGRRWEGRVEADRLAEELVKSGVPREVLLLERASRSTLENATLTRLLVAPLGYRHLGLVSCDWHLARALWCFRHAGFEVAPVAAPSPSIAPHRAAARFLRERGSWLFDRARAPL
jgi:uncharacterized SAM-binding protein YcdF (DUF218 family)